jgi:uncharacterized membrane protein (UPF0127 family)
MEETLTIPAKSGITVIAVTKEQTAAAVPHTARITAGGKTWRVEVVSDPYYLKKGLQNREKLDDDEGMFFIFPDEGFRSMWMNECSLHLDIIFINEEGAVTKVSEGKPNSDRLLNGRCRFVLEVNHGSGIKAGDEIEIEDDHDFDDETDDDKNDFDMIMLDANGDEQYKVKSGQRIFSRKDTLLLIHKAKRAWNARKTKEADKLFADLGNTVFRQIKKQDSNKKEYKTLTV